MNSNKGLFMAVGAAALVVIAVLLFQESQKSDAEKLGDSLEEAGEEMADAVKDATN